MRRSPERTVLALAITALTPLLAGGAHCTESCPPRVLPVEVPPLTLTLEGPAALEGVDQLAYFSRRVLHVEVSRPVTLSLEQSARGAPPRQLAVVERWARVPLFADAASLEEAKKAAYRVITLRPRSAERGPWTARVVVDLEETIQSGNDPIHGNCIGPMTPPLPRDFRLVPPTGQEDAGADAPAETSR